MYRDKRDAETTPEPFGAHPVPAPPDASGAVSGVFVVQKHRARHLHYDFRLELDGVLVSWAVPRGPSLDPAVKRLAMHVENHPIEYARFEGIIPEGNYGAGAVIVWDTGRWTAVEDPRRGLDDGKLLFDLEGYKLRGRWTLVRTKGNKRQAARRQGQGAPGDGAAPAREWLLIKKPDGFADPDGTRELPAESILSGLTVDELAAGPRKAERIAAELDRVGADRRPVDVRAQQPMLCHVADAPFSDPGWIYEIKWDGYRLLAALEDGAPYLRYRSGTDVTAVYPEIARAVASLPFSSLILDGEVVILGPDGRSVFGALQQRSKLVRPSEIRDAERVRPAAMVVFDLLAFDGHDLRPLPLVVRKAVLRQVLPRAGPLRYVDHIEGVGEAFYAEAVKLDLEGVVAKLAGSPYVGARSENWLKMGVERTGDFAVVGYTSPSGTRIGLGALHLATWEDTQWVYAGRVGSGLSGDDLVALRDALETIRVPDRYFEAPSTPGRDDFWVEPRIVCTVQFRGYTDDGGLRFPRFLHLRGDKRPDECRRDPDHGHPDEPADSAGESGGPAVDVDSTAADGGGAPGAPEPTHEPRELRLTNLDKVFWPGRGYTKGDLIDYYRRAAPWMLPYLADRPLALTRYPDGIDGKSFFQKDAPGWVPAWIRTATLWSVHAEREVRYFIAEHADALAFLANMGAIPIHVWASRIGSLERPDWGILDLDPKGAPFAHVVDIARALHALCDELELPSFCKTSGGTGLHVLIPLGAGYTYDQSRTLSLLLARVVETERPDIATTQRPLRKRAGRVYIDCIQNGHGRLLAGPLSARPRPGAPVSMPLLWDEVTPELDVSRFTICTALERLDALGADPLAPILDLRADVPRALALLAARV